MLSLGKSRGGKGKCILDLSDVEAYSGGLIAILIPDEADETTAGQLRKLAAIFGDRAYVSLCLRRRPNDRLRLHNLSNLAARHKVKTVVTNDVLFHDPGRRQLQEIVTCIRNRTTIDSVGFDRERHADRFLKTPEEMHRLFSDYPEALARTREIVERCRFDMSELQYQYPEESPCAGSRRAAVADEVRLGRGYHPIPRGNPRQGPQGDLARTRTHPGDEIRTVFSHSLQHRPVCPVSGNSVPGAGVGSELGGLLLPWYYQHQSGNG